MASHSIKSKTVAAIVVTAFTVLAFLGGYDYYSTGKSLRETRSLQLKACLERLGVTTAPHLWNYDTEKTNELLNLEMNNQHIFAILVINKDGTLFSGIRKAKNDSLISVQSKDSLLKLDNIPGCTVHNSPILSSGKKIGDIALISTEKTLKKQMQNLIVLNVIRIIIVSLILSIIIAILLQQMVIKPIQTTILNIKEITKTNDLSRTLATRRNDEIGDLSNCLNDFFIEINKLVTNLSERVSTLSKTASDVKTVANLLTTHSASITNSSNEVTTTVSKASGTIESIAIDTRTLSESVKSVEIAVEQMNSTVQEISNQCHKEYKITNDAQSKGSAMRESMMNLGTAAKQISSVINLIEGFATQTNLLALNANIEAASAGKAGKGFAVVANEVKILATKTTTMTSEIKKQVQQMQKQVQNAIENAQSISTVIDDISSISQLIVAAVEEQGSTLSGIVKDVSSVHTTSQNIADNVENTSEKLKGISAHISEINTDIHSVAEQGSVTLHHAQAVHECSKDIKTLTDKFVIS